MSNQLKYNAYIIEPKRDFGNMPYWIDGFPVTQGYVVVKDGCNVMPGATWFQTVRDAKRACDILDRVGDTPRFWDEWKKVDEGADALARGEAIR